MKLERVRQGMRVVGIDPSGIDTESGVVLDVNPASATGHEVLVGWDQGVQTWLEASALRAENDE